MSDLVIFGTEYPNVAGIICKDDNGNDVTYTSGGGGGSLTLKMGVLRPDAELVQSYTCDRFAVEDDEITLPAYTTSSTTLIAASQKSIDIDLDEYDYSYAIRALATPVYSIQDKDNGRFVAAVYCEFAEAVVLPKTMVYDGAVVLSNDYRVTNIGNYKPVIYYNSASSLAVTNLNYGCYFANTAPSINSSGTLKFSFYLPSLRIAGSSTYFAQKYMDALTDIRYQYIVEVYRTKKGTANIDGYNRWTLAKHTIDCYNNGGTLT